MGRSILRSSATALCALCLLALPLHTERLQEQMLVSPDWL